MVPWRTAALDGNGLEELELGLRQCDRGEGSVSGMGGAGFELVHGISC